MIDDDFQNIFRKMMEQFFGQGGMPNRNERFGFEMRPDQNHQHIQNKQTTEIEKIELDDKVILLVDNVSDTVEPIVRVQGKRVVVEVWRDEPVVMEDVVDFYANPDESSISLTNGVLEVTLTKGEATMEDEWQVSRA